MTSKKLDVPEGGVGAGPALGRRVAALVLGVRVVGGGGAALEALFVEAAPGRERDPRVHHHLPPVAGRRQTRRRQAAPCVRHLCEKIRRENTFSFRFYNNIEFDISIPRSHCAIAEAMKK